MPAVNPVKLSAPSSAFVNTPTRPESHDVILFSSLDYFSQPVLVCPSRGVLWQQLTLDVL